MQITYNDLIDLAKICIEQARITKSHNVAVDFWVMAREYRKRAAHIHGSRLCKMVPRPLR